MLCFRILAVFFATIMQSTLAAFSLKTHPNGKTTLRSMPHVELFSEDWWSLVPVCSFALLVFVLAYVIALIYIVRRCLKHCAVDGRYGALGFAVQDFRKSQI